MPVPANDNVPGGWPFPRPANDNVPGRYGSRGFPRNPWRFVRGGLAGIGGALLADLALRYGSQSAGIVTVPMNELWSETVNCGVSGYKAMLRKGDSVCGQGFPTVDTIPPSVFVVQPQDHGVWTTDGPFQNIIWFAQESSAFFNVFGPEWAYELSREWSAVNSVAGPAPLPLPPGGFAELATEAVPEPVIESWYPPGPVPRAGSVPRRPGPPGRRTKERKLIPRGAVFGFLWDAFNATTEGMDFVDALYWALPEKVRLKAFRDGKGFVGPVEKLKLLYRHIGEIDVFRAVWNVLVANGLDVVAALPARAEKKLRRRLYNQTGLDYGQSVVTMVSRFNRLYNEAAGN